MCVLESGKNVPTCSTPYWSDQSFLQTPAQFKPKLVTVTGSVGLFCAPSQGHKSVLRLTQLNAASSIQPCLLSAYYQRVDSPQVLFYPAFFFATG